MRHLLYYFLVVCSVVMGPTGAQAQGWVPEGRCALILAARPTLAEALDYASLHGAFNPDRIFLSQNGWYAVSGGLLNAERADDVIAVRQRSGLARLPSDVYCASGDSFERAYDAETGDALAAESGARDVIRYVSSPSDGYLNLRSGPGTSYDIIRELTHGSAVHITGRDGNWRALRTADGTSGWAYAPNLTTAEPSASERRYVSSPGDGYLNLRSGASTDHPVLRQMAHGSSVWVLRQRGSWQQVRHEESGTVGWAYAGNLERTPPPEAAPRTDALSDKIAQDMGKDRDAAPRLEAAYLAFADAWNLSSWRTDSERWIIGISLQSYDPQGMDWCHPQISVDRMVYKEGAHAATLSSIYHTAIEDTVASPRALTIDVAIRAQLLDRGRIGLIGDHRSGTQTVSCTTRYQGDFDGPTFECDTPLYFSDDRAHLVELLNVHKAYVQACLEARIGG